MSAARTASVRSVLLLTIAALVAMAAPAAAATAATVEGEGEAVNLRAGPGTDTQPGDGEARPALPDPAVPNPSAAARSPRWCTPSFAYARCR